jgi:sugar phosphate isomerase/epimerase
MHTRRQFAQLALGGVAATAFRGSRLSAAIDPTINGVKVGAITYCFRSIPRPTEGDYMDTLIDAYKQTRIGLAELESVRVEPPLGSAGGGRMPVPVTPEYLANRRKLREWRITVPMNRFREIRTKFANAGISLFSYVVTFVDDHTDEEIERTFEAAKTLGVRVIGTNQTQTSMAWRLKPFAERHNVALGWHNHANVADIREVASLDSFARLFAVSRQFKANLDIGHFVAGNNDAIAFLREHHDRITHLHLKDRKRDNGQNQPWGQGDTPVAAVLQLMKREKYPFPAMIEYEYMSQEPAVAEVQKCLQFIRTATA